MKYLLYVVALLIFLQNDLSSHESKKESPNAPFLQLCGSGILSVKQHKAYLKPENLYFFQKDGFLLNDDRQWISVGEIECDQTGYYIDMFDPRCPNGHIGIYKVKSMWYCNEPYCEYSIGENFNH